MTADPIIALANALTQVLTELRAERERRVEVEAESADLTKALTGLTRQGSEFFVRKGDRYVADIPVCVADVRERFQHAHQTAVNAVHAKQAAEARALTAEAALAEAVEDWAWLDAHPNHELSFDWQDEEDDCAWVVHCVSGGRNDREWEEIVRAPTSHEAVRRARALHDKLTGKEG